MGSGISKSEGRRRPSLAAIVDLDSRPCQRCGTCVLGSPEKCPQCAEDFDGRPRLGSRERPHDCRPAPQVTKTGGGVQVQVCTGDGNVLAGGDLVVRRGKLDTRDWRALLSRAKSSSRDGGAGRRSGGKIGSGSREGDGDDVAVAVPDERRPSERAPLRRLLGYLIRQWLRAWVKVLEGRR